MFSKEQFLIIADMQDKMNNLAAGADWKQQNLDWSLAFMTEAVEASAHYNWKWWAKEVPNIPQAAIETVDMLHFAMSGVLVQIPDAATAYDMIQQAVNDMLPAQHTEMDTWDFHSFIKESSVHAVVGNFGFALYLTVRAAALVGLDTNQLFNAYIAKNVLNKFRKASGYKEGTYIKMWNGVEDNVYLEGILNSFSDKNEVPTPEQIETELNAVYVTVLENAKTQAAPDEATQH